MDHLSVDEEFDQEVLQAMRDHGIDREEAFLTVALRRGEVYGAGDLVCTRPLTLEERRAIGLDLDPEEIIARDRAGVAEEASTAMPDQVLEEADSQVVSSGVRRR